MNRKILTGLLAVTVLIGAACSPDNGSARKEEQAAAEQQLNGYLKAQPVPVFNWSQLRQNLIELETAQSNTTATTTFFFNMGVTEPIMSCPSIGFPIPATYQLTNPLVPAGDIGDNGGGVTINQLEATGVYTADTTGTYVMCIADDGKVYASYWEGFVSTVTGPAEWADGQITLTGAPTAEFSTGK